MSDYDIQKRISQLEKQILKDEQLAIRKMSAKEASKEEVVEEKSKKEPFRLHIKNRYKFLFIAALIWLWLTVIHPLWIEYRLIGHMSWAMIRNTFDISTSLQWAWLVGIIGTTLSVILTVALSIVSVVMVFYVVIKLLIWIFK